MLETFRRTIRDHDEASWAPLLFTLAAGEYEELTALCKAEGVRVVDMIERQLLEWARIQKPSEPFGSEACRAIVARELEDAGATIETYGTWCYYPWRRAVAHLAPEDRYFTIRTNRNCDKITAEEQLAMSKKRVGVIGLSVGHCAAMVIAQERLCSEIRIGDFDRLDLSNINRLRTSVLNVGEAKATICARDIAEMDPYINVRAFHDGITDENIERFILEGGKLDAIVEECDTLPIKVRVRELAREHGIPVVMDTNDRGLLDIERFDLEPGRPLLHGLIGAHTPATAASLDAAGRLAFFCDFFGGEASVSAPLRESMKKMGKTLVSFPQLSSEVHLGGALVGHAVREIFRNRLRRSGRYSIDLHRLMDDAVAELA